VVLLDEIEKAHPDIFNVLLQVYEDGHLTDGLGNTIDFKNTIIIMTSNIGARFIEKKGRMGFASGDAKDMEKGINEMVMGEVKRTFNPEFINRVDEIIIFDALTDQDLVKITRLLIEQLNVNLREKGIAIEIRDDAVHWLLQKTLSDRSYGARPLRRAIQRHIEDALSEAFIRGQIRTGRSIEIGVRDGGLYYRQDERGGALSA
jgi:ATP-dependent Clp protease ATP-binding subunit ClpC